MTLCKCLISMLLVLSPMNLVAQSIKIGTTYPVVEKDALAEIEQKAEAVNWHQAMNFEHQNWKATQSLYLPNVAEARKYTYIPWYTTQYDIKDGKGRIIYPKGFTFNPLAHIKLPQRLVVTNPINYTIIKDRLLQNDLILLTEGDVIEFSKSQQRPIFLLDAQLKLRLGVVAQPAIVTQEDSHFVIEEIPPEEKFKNAK